MPSRDKNRRKGRKYPKRKKLIRQGDTVIGYEKAGKIVAKSPPLKKGTVQVGPKGRHYYVGEHGELRRID